MTNFNIGNVGNILHKKEQYEVRFFIGEVECVAGWTDDPTGGALVESINKHPGNWHHPRVIDGDNNG